MNTVAHMLMASAILARRESPARNAAVLAGAILPDVSMFVFFAWSRVQNWSGHETWNVQYWNEPWQTIGALSNSFFLFGLIGSVALWRRWSLLTVICAAALIHLALDLPLHAEDAHRHFWPVTDWRFFSPVSYWDPDHYGWLGGLLESACVLASIAVLWLRFTEVRWRLAFAGLIAIQLVFLSIQIAWVVN